MKKAEFERDLRVIREELAKCSSNPRHQYSQNNKYHFLIGWVTAPTAPTYTSSQLRKIFNLAEEV